MPPLKLLRWNNVWSFALVRPPQYIAALMTLPTLPERETALATIRYTAADRVEVVFKPNIPFTVAGIQEMLQVRSELGASGKHRVLILLPEHVEFDMAMITTDHYKVIPQPNTEAVAWVVRNERNATFTRLYLSYWPSPFPSEVFLLEADGRAWLESF
jgi:hypothetical protein